MSEFVPPSEANSPDVVMREEVLRYVEGLQVGDLRFTVFHDHFSIYAALNQIFESDDALETAPASEREVHESDKRVAENQYAIAIERQNDRCATVPGYDYERLLLSDRYDQWINQYEELAGVDFGEAQKAINSMMRHARYRVIERSAPASPTEAV
jgi:hypothetical protein